MARLDRSKALEIIFTAAFSAVVFALFFLYLGANGLVLGNDSAVHLNTALYYLNAGKLSIGDIAWYTPLYHLIFDNLLAFTGITDFTQMLLLMKVFTALVNWLVVFSVYVVAAKFLDKKTGVLAAAVMLLCTPLFQQNAWGGYTSLLSLAFMTLCLMYLALSLKGTGNTAVAFILSFCLVLSHQLATFLAVIIIAPVLFVGVFKLRGRQAKGLIAILLGGAAAFGIYYLRPILPYLGELVSIVLFQITVYSLQIPFVNFESFMMYFGFFLFFSFTGLVVGYFELRKRQSLGFFALLTLAFLVPLLLSQSYLVGILLPYTRFVYFLMAPLAIFAAITLAYVVQTLLRVFESHRVGVRGFALKAFAIVLVVALAVVMVVRFDTVTANMSVNIDYYSSSDLSGYEVGTFVKNNFGVNDTGVTTQKPGNWLTMYSGRTILAQTHPTVDYSYNANCVLDLSYEITQPVTTLKVYDSKAVSDANFVFHNLVWQQGTYFEGDDAYLQYRDPNGTLVIIPLSSMQRTVSFNEVDWPKNITITYDDPRATLTQTMLVANTSYAVTVTWALMSKQTLNFVTLSLYEHMDTTLLYNKANIPGLLSWANPLENATKSEPGQWAVTEFNRENMYENSTIDIYDQEDQIGFALKFVDVPAFGNVGALAANGKIDAVRWQYDVYQLIPGYGVTVKYQTLNFAMDNVAQLEDPQQMDSLFDLQVEPFTVECRDFPSIISEEQIRFIVYDVTQFDPKILGSRWLQLVFANNEFVVLTIKDSHPTVNVLYNCTD